MAKVGRAARVASRQRVETITADKTITTAETGELYLISGTDVAITLPAAQDGAYFKFIVSVKVASPAITIATGAGAGTLAGSSLIATAGGAFTLESNAQAELGDNHHTFTIADSGSNHLLAGSAIECFSDGTSWFLLAHLVRDNASVTATFTGS